MLREDWWQSCHQWSCPWCPPCGTLFHRCAKGSGWQWGGPWGAGSSVAPSLLLFIPETLAHPTVDLVATALNLMCVKYLRWGGGHVKNKLITTCPNGLWYLPFTACPALRWPSGLQEHGRKCELALFCRVDLVMVMEGAISRWLEFRPWLVCWLCG